MRAAYVINSVEGGGAAAPVPRVLELARRHGVEPFLLALAPRDRRALGAIVDAGFETIVREGGETDHASALAWLHRIVAARRPGLIWTSLTRATVLGQMVGAARGVPVVSWQHAAFLKPGNLRLLRLTRRLSRLWIADSPAVAEFARDRIGVSASRVAVWPLFEADPAAPQATAWRPGGPLRLGTLGRLHPVKGYDVLIDALARLRADGFAMPAPLEVVVAGDGEQRGALVARAETVGIADQIRFTGFTDRPREFLAGLHLYVQPSRSEGLCLAAHEAMQAGLPVIASAVGELASSVQDRETGRLVCPDDVPALEEALRHLLSAPERLETLGIASRARVLERFGLSAFAAAGAEIIARLPVSRALAAAA